ncbi:MAG: RimK family alpha-L-glutamate ligase [Deltaproteobacteria bacterium]|nr:RimK family alpha-L-glutamate ligase [Deltaproteobacteria bacterium]
MKGWIIYRKPETHVSEDVYEMKRFREEAEKQNIEMEVYPPEVFDLSISHGDKKSIRVNGKKEPLPDFIIPRMGAGTTYFTLAVIRHFESLGVHSVNSSVAIEAVKDKLYTQQILSTSSLPIPDMMLVKFPVDIDMIAETLGFPVVIKTIHGAQGKGVFLAENRTKLADMMQLIEVTNDKANIILQQYIPESRGRDLRVFMIGGKPVACMERTAPEGSFKANFSQGGKVKSYPMNHEIEWIATEASRLMGLEISGVDLLFDDKGFKVCEINSAPGFRGIETACEINIPDHIFHYVRIRLGIFN